MGLDPRTTLVAAALVTGVTSLLLALFRWTRRTYPGFDQWAAASALVALGFALLALRGVAPDLASIVLANVAVVTASVLRLRGTFEYLGAPPMRRIWWVLPPLAGAALVLLRFVVDSFAGRTVAAVTAVALPAAATGLAFLRAAGREAPLLHRLTAALFLSQAAALALRAASAPHLPSSLLAEHAPQTAFLLVTPLIESAGNVLFLMLNSCRLEQDLRNALDEVRTLRGLLPICSWCRRIRDDGGSWRPIESLVAERSGIEFSHGICPECAAGVRHASHAPRSSASRAT